jgi:chitinase
MNYWSCYARNFQVKNIPEDVIDIQYNFWNINESFDLVPGDKWSDLDKRFVTDGILPYDSWDNDGTENFYGNFRQFKKLLNNGRQLNISLVVGNSTNLLTAINRNNQNILITNILDKFRKYGIFNGITFGYIGIVEQLEFIKKLRKAFDSNGMINYQINLCFDNSFSNHSSITDYINYVDNFFAMTHDFPIGPNISTFHTNPRKSNYNLGYSCDEISDYYIALGIPSDKLFISGAFYSRGFSNTDGPGTYGIYGSSDMSWEPGIVDYKVLPLQGSTEYTDSESKAAYSYDYQRRVLNTYDNSDSILEKCKIIYKKDLGGIVIYEISGDKPINHPKSLIKILKNNLTHGKPANTIKIKLEIDVGSGEITTS